MEMRSELYGTAMRAYFFVGVGFTYSLRVLSYSVSSAFQLQTLLAQGPMIESSWIYLDLRSIVHRSKCSKKPLALAGLT